MRLDEEDIIETIFFSSSLAVRSPSVRQPPLPLLSSALLPIMPALPAAATTAGTAAGQRAAAAAGRSLPPQNPSNSSHLYAASTTAAGGPSSLWVVPQLPLNTIIHLLADHGALEAGSDPRGPDVLPVLVEGVEDCLYLSQRERNSVTRLSQRQRANGRQNGLAACMGSATADSEQNWKTIRRLRVTRRTW